MWFINVMPGRTSSLSRHREWLALSPFYPEVMREVSGTKPERDLVLPGKLVSAWYLTLPEGDTSSFTVLKVRCVSLVLRTILVWQVVVSMVF